MRTLRACQDTQCGQARPEPAHSSSRISPHEQTLWTVPSEQHFLDTLPGPLLDLVEVAPVVAAWGAMSRRADTERYHRAQLERNRPKWLSIAGPRSVTYGSNRCFCQLPRMSAQQRIADTSRTSCGVGDATSGLMQCSKRATFEPDHLIVHEDRRLASLWDCRFHEAICQPDAHGLAAPTQRPAE